MIGDEYSIGVFFGKLWVGFGDELNNFGGIPSDELSSGDVCGSDGVVNVVTI